MAKSSRFKTGAINAEGIGDLSKALKLISEEAQRELRLANKEVATFVAADAKTAAYTIGGVAAHVAPSIKASAGATFSAVALGGPAYPMAGGAEFGSVKYKQFKMWRGNSTSAGYFVYPAIRQDIDRIETTYKSAIDEIIRRNFGQ